MEQLTESLSADPRHAEETRTEQNFMRAPV